MVKDLVPGVRAVEFATREDAEGYLSGISSAVKNVDFKGGPETFHIQYVGGVLGECSLHRGRHSPLTFDIVESDVFHLLVPLSGSFSVGGPRLACDANAQRHAIVLPPSASGSARTSEDFTGISLFAPERAVRQHAARMIDPDREIRIESGPGRVVQITDPVVAALTRNMSSSLHELEALGRIGMSPMAAAGFDEVLLGLLTAAVTEGARPLHASIALDPGSATVRRAQDFIREHSAEPIRLAEVAARLGVGLRALQLSFQKRVGCSPREFLQKCRLEAARSALLAASGDDTVTEIALGTGFTDLAHFSRTYRKAYGELPSATLARSRGR